MINWRFSAALYCRRVPFISVRHLCLKLFASLVQLTQAATLSLSVIIRRIVCIYCSRCWVFPKVSHSGTNITQPPDIISKHSIKLLLNSSPISNAPVRKSSNVPLVQTIRNLSIVPVMPTSVAAQLLGNQPLSRPPLQ
jgi:hypothetical protein